MLLYLIYKVRWLVTTVILGCFMASCGKQSQVTKSASAVKEPRLSSFEFWSLPMTERTIDFNVGRGDVLHPPPNGTSAFFDSLHSVGDAVAKDNHIVADKPYGRFFVNEKLNVIGFSFLPEQEFETPNSPLGHVGRWAPYITRAPSSYRTYEIGGPVNDAEGGKISVCSVDSLQSIKGIEFIDFGIARFSDGVWRSLASLASSGSLRGLVVFRGSDMLAVRSHAVVPEIRGLVLYVSTIGDLQEFGSAFPNLGFLCLCTQNPELIGQIMRTNVLKDVFSNLRSLMISQGMRMKGRQWLEDSLAKDSPPIRFLPNCIPTDLKWLCIDGRLFSADEMVYYDIFAKNLRFKHLDNLGHMPPNRDIEVVFYSFGWGGGYARSMDAFEYNTLDRYWREVHPPAK